MTNIFSGKGEYINAPETSISPMVHLRLIARRIAANKLETSACAVQSWSQGFFSKLPHTTALHSKTSVRGKNQLHRKRHPILPTFLLGRSREDIPLHKIVGVFFLYGCTPSLCICTDCSTHFGFLNCPRIWLNQHLRF